MAHNSVRIIHATLRPLLNAALDDGIIVANPADRLGRQLRVVASPMARQEEIKALTRERVSDFLASARTISSLFYALFMLLARAGLRLGEALALHWNDVNFRDREIRVAR